MDRGWLRLGHDRVLGGRCVCSNGGYSGFGGLAIYKKNCNRRRQERPKSKSQYGFHTPSVIFNVYQEKVVATDAIAIMKKWRSFPRNTRLDPCVSLRQPCLRPWLE